LKNILNSVFETQHQSAPFEQIQTSNFIPALELEISKTLEEIYHICSNPEKPTFENTLEALEESGEQLGIISGILFNLNSAETSNELQEVTQKAAPLLTKFQNDVRLNKVLFDRIKSIYDLKETLGLDVEQLTLIEKEYKGFEIGRAHV
jgi:peptidyl-dipeptidase Dcp